MATVLTDPIVEYLRDIAARDPEGLGGVRTTSEIAARYCITKDAARWRLEKLVREDEIECLGALKSETGKPVGWKIA